MTRVLPLYAERPSTLLELEQGRDRDPNCTLCALGSVKRRNTCIPPGLYGDPGGLLVVSEHPADKKDDIKCEPFVGLTGQYLRPLLKRWWSGSIILDNAIKCWSKKKHLFDEAAVTACRGYLKRTVEEAKPTRILAMGQLAVMSVLGRKVHLLKNRKGYGWLYVDGKPVPVFMMINPYMATQNRALRTWFEEDLKWALTTDPPFGPVWEAGEVRIVESMDDAQAAATDIREAGWFSYDVETSGFQWNAHQIVCASLNPAGRDYAWAWADVALNHAGMRGVLVSLLRDPDIGKTGSNLKYDELSTSLELGCTIRNVIGDNRLLRKLLDGEASGYLGDMAELVGMGGHKDEANQALIDACRVVVKVAKWNASDQMELPPMTGSVRQDVLKSIRPGERTKAYAFGFMPRDVCIRYNALDTVASGRLEILLDVRRQLDDQALTRTYRETVMPAASAVKQVEEWGVYVDPDNIHHFQQYLQMRKLEVLTELESWGGCGFNPSSYEQVRHLLFKKLKLPSLYKTETKQDSTDKEALEAIRHLHPVAGLVLDYRKVIKLDGNYATGLLRHIRNDGRIHPSILLDGTRSGRTSCTNPNLQTIPRDSDSKEGKMARDCFAAPPGYVLASLDYSQIELRVAAMLSQDLLMIELFKQGEDFHWATAREIARTMWGLSHDKLEKKHRTAAKTVNFALLYGMSDAGLAAKLGCSKAEATRVREAVLGKYPRLGRWIRERLQEAKRTGYCWTWWDGGRARRRSLWQIADKGDMDRSRQERITAEHSSWNTPIQGTASDYLVRSMTEAVCWILDNGIDARVVLPVHDSLLMEIREDCVGEVINEVETIMTSWNSGGVPLVVDIEVGPAWGSLERVDSAVRAKSGSTAQEVKYGETYHSRDP